MGTGSDRIQLGVVTQMRDLGVLVDNKLNFHDHIVEVVKKANSRLGLIKRTFEYLDSHLVSILYKSMVRPILEYSSTACLPQFVGDSILLEKVQQRATKLAVEIKTQPYSDRMKFMKLPSLAFRRKRYCCLQIFRMIQKYDNVNPGVFF
ncbi:uncharacterized protein B0403.1-like [Antedon mediterranea]|uniref:uncharacterized protein B0403.1-like n=1 Tax=Antedon mediterranea TaxID=105859 RepID=UPI003AF88696